MRINMITAIWIVFILLACWTAYFLFRDYLKYRDRLENNSWLKTGLTGFVGNFFDTLGIGSFAIETAMLKFMKQSEDRLLPATLNVGNAIPTVLLAIIFVRIIEVEPITLVLMVVASGAGALMGAGVVSKLPEKTIRLIMGMALLITAGFMLAAKLNWTQAGGDAIGLDGTKLVLAVAVNFILGAIMTAGIVGVLIAAFIVKSLELDILRWVVLAVIIYTALIMLKAGLRKNIEMK